MKLQAIFRNGALRLGVWAAFIILAAALARLADLETSWIIGVIAIAWALVALMERSAQRVASSPRVPAAQVPAETPSRAAPTTAPARATTETAPAPARGTPRPAPRDPSEPDPDDWLAGDAEIDPGPPPTIVRAPPAPAAPAPAPPAPGDPIAPVTAAPRSVDVTPAAPVHPPVEHPAEPATAPAVERASPATTIPPLPPAVVEPPQLLSPLPRRGPASGEGSWNLWELERLARDAAGADRARDEERSLILMYLREFASSEGTLGHEFDDLVRESFGDLLPRR